MIRAWRFRPNPSSTREHEEFHSGTLWSLSPFTSAFKKLDPIPAFNATAKLGQSIERFH